MSYRQAILDAALLLYSERGFEDTSVAELAKITGAAEGTIFHHFKNKEELFLAVLRHVREIFCQELERVRQDGHFETGLEMLEALSQLFLSLGETHPQEFKILFQSYTYKLASANPTCHAQLEALYGAFTDALAEAFTLGIDDGSIRAVSVEHQATLLLAMLSGVVRFKVLNLWSSTRSYRDALELCRYAFAAHGVP